MSEKPLSSQQERSLSNKKRSALSRDLLCSRMVVSTGVDQIVEKADNRSEISYLTLGKMGFKISENT